MEVAKKPTSFGILSTGRAPHRPMEPSFDKGKRTRFSQGHIIVSPEADLGLEPRSPLPQWGGGWPSLLLSLPNRRTS